MMVRHPCSENKMKCVITGLQVFVVKLHELINTLWGAGKHYPSVVGNQQHVATAIFGVHKDVG